MKQLKLKASIASTFATICMAVVPISQATTIKAAMSAPLRSVDPIVTTAYIVQDFSNLVYETLLSRTQDGEIRPQMVEGWEVSDDGKKYTFTLREGLKWHDGNPVTAADCIASIKRWAEQDSMGKLMMERVNSIDEVDDNTFSISLDTETDIVLRALSKESTSKAFMMPERLAKTPSTKALTEVLGSGPFVFNDDEYVPGVKAVFDKNEDYVPRDEPADGSAGGHVAHVDRVEWVSMPDATTALSALRNGEIDIFERVPADLISLIENDDNLKIINPRVRYGQAIIRLNHLQPPFDNKTIRQAALAAIGQEDILAASVGSPDYYSICSALFGCETKYATDIGADKVIKPDPERAKELLEEAGYDGTPIALLHPSDFPIFDKQIPVIAQQLRQGGFEVDVKTMDWQAVLQRRAVKKPVSEGGWNALNTALLYPDYSEPLSNFAIPATGEDAWIGWPDIPKMEELRMKMIDASSEEEQKEIADQMQEVGIDEVIVIPLGEYSRLYATNKSITGMLETPTFLFWNLKKEE